jgi:hypothetical protein
VILLGAAWLDRPALGLTMGTLLAGVALVLFSHERKPKRGRSR